MGGRSTTHSRTSGQKRRQRVAKTKNPRLDELCYDIEKHRWVLEELEKPKCEVRWPNITFAGYAMAVANTTVSVIRIRKNV